jgi:integrase
MRKMRKAKDWFPNDKATHEWLDSQKKSTRHTYTTNWKYFLEFSQMTGDQILADRQEDKKHKWERKVLAFKQWMMDEKKQSEYTATAAAATARGFFAFHYSPLKYRRTESRKLKERKRKTEDYYFSREDLAKMVQVADLTEKYVITAGKSFGLRASDFMRLTRGNVEPYIKREIPISLGEIPTKKEGVSAYPFIDSDAYPIIKLMVEQMTREGRTKPEDRILTWKSQIELTNVLQRVAKKAGLDTGNKIVRFHCLRKFLIDRLSSFMSESKWKQIVGKAIDEKAYVSSDSLREDYKRAMTETTFSEATRSESDIRIKAAIDQLRSSGRFPEEYLKGLENEWLGKNPDAAVRHISLEAEAIQRILDRQGMSWAEWDMISKDVINEEMEQIKKERMRPKTATNGGSHDCQRIVSEQELPTLLAEG